MTVTMLAHGKYVLESDHMSFGTTHKLKQKYCGSSEQFTQNVILVETFLL